MRTLKQDSLPQRSFAILSDSAPVLEILFLRHYQNLVNENVVSSQIVLNKLKLYTKSNINFDTKTGS